MQPLLKRIRRERLVSASDAELLLAEYERFLQLKKAARDWTARLLSPSPLVDRVWHLHILDTLRYASHCRKLCGRILHHNPDGGEQGREERYRRTLEAYQRVFGAPAPERFWERPAVADRGSEIVVTVRMLTGREHLLLARANDSIWRVKLHLEAVAGHCPGQVRLIFEGRQAADDKLLSEYVPAGEQNVTVHGVLALAGC